MQQKLKLPWMAMVTSVGKNKFYRILRSHDSRRVESEGFQFQVGCLWIFNRFNKGLLNYDFSLHFTCERHSHSSEGFNWCLELKYQLFQDPGKASYGWLQRFNK